jgi:hypothetical protein
MLLRWFHNLIGARVVQAIGDQVMHALPAHVGEVHRRGWWVLHHHISSSPLAHS